MILVRRSLHESALWEARANNPAVSKDSIFKINSGQNHRNNYDRRIYIVILSRGARISFPKLIVQTIFWISTGGLHQLDHFLVDKADMLREGDPATKAPTRLSVLAQLGLDRMSAK